MNAQIEMDFAPVEKPLGATTCTTCRGFGLRLDAGEPLPIDSGLPAHWTRPGFTLDPCLAGPCSVCGAALKP